MTAQKNTKKISYIIKVEKRGKKREIFLILPNNERRYLFYTKPIKNKTCLKHVKKENLGSLVDSVTLEYLQAIISDIYSLLSEKDEGNYRYEAIYDKNTENPYRKRGSQKYYSEKIVQSKLMKKE